jgi:AcrR family transcriptional regulator
MSTEEEAALLRSLWGVPRLVAGRPGPKPSLTLEAILEAGVAVADDRAGPVLSMRAVADRLGCTPMALYSHVTGKDALLVLMADRVYRELEPVRSVPEWAIAVAELVARHPWLTDVSWARPMPGPNEQQALERLLELLAGHDLRPDATRAVASATYALSRQAGRLIGDARSADRAGPSEAEWWAGHSAAMAELVPDFAARFPHSTALTSPGSPPPGEGYLEWLARGELERGIDLLLRGAAVRPARRPRA